MVEFLRGFFYGLRIMDAVMGRCFMVALGLFALTVLAVFVLLGYIAVDILGN